MKEVDDMKLRDLIVTTGILTLGACTTYTAQNVSNVEQAVEVDTESTVVTAADTEEAVDLDRMICKRRVVTGSRFTRKVCMTWEQWRDRAEGGKDYTKAIQSRSRSQEAEPF